MSLFKRIFGSQNKKTNPDEGPMPTRGLNLQYLPIPENGSSLAAHFVKAVKNVEQMDLDYSPETLEFVDSFLERFKKEGLTVNDFAETIFIAGCYIGQVMVLHNNGIWIKMEEVNLPPGISMMPIVVRLPSSKVADPIAKAFKRFYFGESDNIPYFYQVFTSPD